MDGKQIYQNFTQGNTEALQIASDLVRTLADEFMDEAQSLLKARDRMLEHWEGDSADAAGKGIDPLAQAHQDSAPHIDRTMRSLGQQSQMFADSANTVVPVPDAPEKPNPWVSGAKALLPGGAVSTYHDYKSYSDGMAQHNAANETNVRVMNQYSSATSQSSSSFPADYGVLESDGATVGIGDERGDSGIAGRGADTPDATGASAYGSPGGAGVPAGSYSGAPGAGASSSGGGGLAAGAVAGAGGLPGGSTAPGGTPSAPGGVPPRAGAPLVGGVPIGGGAVGGAGSDTTRRGGTSRAPGSAGNQNAGARLTGGGAKGGAGTPGGTGAPKTTGANPNLAAGRGSGSGTPAGGAPAAAEAAKGVSGRGGAPMAGGAGAGRGKEEDKEKKSADYLKNEHPFELTEQGEVLRDPETGMPVVPQVIGDPGFDPHADPRAGQ